MSKKAERIPIKRLNTIREECFDDSEHLKRSGSSCSFSVESLEVDPRPNIMMEELKEEEKKEEVDVDAPPEERKENEEVDEVVETDYTISIDMGSD